MKNTASDRWVAYLVSITAAVLVLLFGLQRFGIWQPAEIHVADLARELIAGRPVAFDRPPGQIAAVALGFRLGGVSELWGRLPTALLAFASACALMAAARGAGDRRLAAYVGITYATIPLVFMNARQMFGGGVAQSASTLALAGFVLLLWGRGRRWQLGGAALAAVGLLLGVRAAGVMLGVVPILGAVGLAGLLRFGAESRLTRLTSAVSFVVAAALAIVCIRVASRELTGYSTWVGASPQSAIPTQWQTFEVFFEQIAHGTFPWTGLVPFGLLRLVSPPSQVPGGETDPTLPADETQDSDAWREAGMRLTAFLAIALGFALQTFHMQLFGMSAFVMVAPIALGLAVLLRDAERERTPWRTVAVAAALLTVLMLRDFLQFPKAAYAALGLPDGGPTFPTGFAIKFSEWTANVKAARAAHGEMPPLPAEGFHIIETGLFLALSIVVLFQGTGRVDLFAWRRPYTWMLEVEADARRLVVTETTERGRPAGGTLLLANLRALLGVLALVCVIVGLSVRSIPTLTTPGRDGMTALAAAPVGIVVAVVGFIAVWNLFAWLGRTENPLNKLLGSRVAWVPVAALMVALLYTQGFMVSLSEHMSPRGVWAVIRSLRHGEEPVARFGGPSDDPATRYYTQVVPEMLRTEDEAVRWITGGRRSFLVLGNDVFPALNRAYRHERHHNIPIADASNSNLFVAVSELEGRPNRNPLEPWVRSERPPMRHPAREPSVFENTYQYIGYDLDSNGLSYVPLGGSFKVTFHFHVVADATRNWQLFVHTDGQGPRINGDHEGVGGRYPTRHWQSGDFISDQITVNVPLTYRPGVFTVFLGFFDGGDRMRLEGGDHDRDNRVVVARVNVR